MDHAVDGPFGLLGTGVIGAGWATRALVHGYDVVAFDPAVGAEDRLRSAVARAWPSARKLAQHEGADPNRLTFARSIEEVASVAGFIQESVPEVVDLKRSVLGALDESAPPEVILASSTSGILPSVLQNELRHPGRLVVGHPFNPVYLLPLVEVVGGEATSPAVIERAITAYRHLGMRPLRVRNEIEGFLSDRLQEAMWREILHLVADGVASTGELDDAIVYGPGLRWALMGTNLTFHLAGGEAGMRHMLEQFGPALQWPWTKLEAPPLTDELIDRMVAGTLDQAGSRSVAELERLRDDALVAVMRALRETGLGAGELIAPGDREPDLLADPWTPGTAVALPLTVLHRRVEPHDTGGDLVMATCDPVIQAAVWAFLRYVGLHPVASKPAAQPETIERHVKHNRGAPPETRLQFTAQLLGFEADTIHLFIAAYDADRGDQIASDERLIRLLGTGGRTSLPLPEATVAALAAIWESHQHAPRPPQAIMNITR